MAEDADRSNPDDRYNLSTGRTGTAARSCPRVGSSLWTTQNAGALSFPTRRGQHHDGGDAQSDLPYGVGAASPPLDVRRRYRRPEGGGFWAHQGAEHSLPWSCSQLADC